MTGQNQLTTVNPPPKTDTPLSSQALIRSLTTEQRRALLQKSTLRPLLHLAGYLTVIVFFSIWIVYSWPLWPVAMVPLGILLVFLFTLHHETVHRTAFKQTWLNNAVARVCGIVLILPTTWFSYFHWAHHRYTQIPGQDPELASAKPETRTDYLIHMSGIRIWRDNVMLLWTNGSGKCSDSFVPKTASAKVRQEARYMLIFYSLALLASIVGQTSLLVWLWILPLLIGQPFLRAYLLAEHGHCPYVSDMFENTRTTFTHAAVQALAWNMPFHAEHHAFPAVPFYRLPDFHLLTQRHLRMTSTGYIPFNKHYLANQTHRT